MKLATRQKWVDALRSGQYKQGRGCLRYEDRYCCLGVLAAIEGLLDAEGSVNGCRELLPTEIIPIRTQKILADANDCGETFTDIANKIESIVTCED
jgi:hypothetical protein